MDKLELVGKKLVLILWQNDDDAVLVSGKVVGDSNRLWLELGADQKPLFLDEEWLSRIQPVKSDIADIVGNADFVLSLSVGALPPDADLGDYEPTGLRWPDDS